MKYSRLLIIICFIGAIVAWAVFIVPKYFKYQDLQSKIASQNSLLANQTTYYQQLQAIDDKLDSYAGEIEKIDTMIPNQMDYSSLINYFYTIGKETGILIQSVTVGTQGKLADQDRIKENAFFITSIGTYNSFQNFLARIEKSARLFEVNEMSFSATKSESGFFNYNLRLKTYSY